MLINFINNWGAQYNYFSSLTYNTSSKTISFHLYVLLLEACTAAYSALTIHTVNRIYVGDLSIVIGCLYEVLCDGFIECFSGFYAFKKSVNNLDMLRLRGECARLRDWHIKTNAK